MTEEAQTFLRRVAALAALVAGIDLAAYGHHLLAGASLMIFIMIMDHS